MAGKTNAHGVEDFVTVYQTFFFDLPVVGAKWGLGIGEEKELTETAWKGYDAWVRLTTATIANLSRMPVFGEVVVRSFDAMLRWQRLSNALVGASFAGLWPAVGLPTAAAVQGLREELHSAATDLRLVASIQANGQLATHPLIPLRERLHSSPAGLLVQSKKSVALTPDLSEYFEPVADSAPSAPGPEHTKSAVRTPDLSEYFEPVADSAPSAPGPEQRESNEREAITKLAAQTEALQIDRSRTEHPLPSWLPYGRAGGQAANKRAAKGKALR